MRSVMWRRVDIQVSVFTAVIVALLPYSIFMIQCKVTYQDMLRGLSGQAEHICTCIGERFGPDTFKHIPTREDVPKEDYTRTYDRFQRIREITGVMYLYTAKIDENGEFMYVIDCLDLGAEDFRYPGNPIERETYPGIKRAMQGEIVIPEEIKKTDWGKIPITYMPVYEEGKVIGVTGIEFRADHQYRTYQNLRRALPVSTLPFSLIACLMSRFLFRRISSPFCRGISSMDYLTQLKNRDAYQLGMNNLEAKKMKSRISFILIDLNSLKHVSDALGHDVGDRYTTYISKAYLNMRTGERVMCRIGGDEFMVMMPKAIQVRTKDFVARFKKEFDKLVFRSEFTFSWGSAISSEEADDNLFSTCRKVDKNMYMKKQKHYEDKKT